MSWCLLTTQPGGARSSGLVVQPDRNIFIDQVLLKQGGKRCNQREALGGVSARWRLSVVRRVLLSCVI